MTLTAPPRHLDVAEWMATWEFQEDAFELVAGVPTVSPAEAPLNISAAMLIRDTIAPVVGATHRLLPSCGVHLHSVEGRDTVRQPDLAVVPRSVDIRHHFVRAADVTLVVEVVSPGSTERDWVAKRADYARAGIPSYLIVDVRPDVPQLWLFDRLLPVEDALAGGSGTRAATTYPRYADPTGDGTSVTIRIDDHDPITITAAELAEAL